MLTKKLKLTAPKFQAHLSPGKVPYREDDRPGSRLQVRGNDAVTAASGNSEVLINTFVADGEEKAVGDNPATREKEGRAGQARLYPD
jgi:hypothetical protein